jgi:hypothetical protein
MTTRRNHELCEYDLLGDRVARAPLQVSLFLGSTTDALDSAGPSQDVTWLTVQRMTQFIQDICTIHSGAPVIESEQGRVGHTGFLSQSIDRPTPFIEDFSEFTDNHAVNLAGPANLCQINHIYELCFTYYKRRSKVGLHLIRGLRALGMQWKTTSISLRTGISKTFPGLLSTALGGRS